MHDLGPGELATKEWLAAGLALPDLHLVREYRLARVREYLRKFDYTGIVLYDPVNVRYATDSTNMQVWLLHNASRYVFVPTEGPVVLWEFDHCNFLSDHTHTVVMPMIGNNTKVNAQNARIVTTRTAGRSNQTIGGMARNPR